MSKVGRDAGSDEKTDRLDRFIEGLMELARIGAGDMNWRRQWGVQLKKLPDAVKRAALLTREHQVHTWIEMSSTVRVDERAIAEVVYTAR